MRKDTEFPVGEVETPQLFTKAILIMMTPTPKRDAIRPLKQIRAIVSKR